MLKTNLMSKKYITNLLEQDNLYKDGDYSDVFINQPSMTLNVTNEEANSGQSNQIKKRL